MDERKTGGEKNIEGRKEEEEVRREGAGKGDDGGKKRNG